MKYRVHTAQSGWLAWVNKGNKNDTVNGVAGIQGQAIDGVQLNYITPKEKIITSILSLTNYETIRMVKSKCR